MGGVVIELERRRAEHALHELCQKLWRNEEAPREVVRLTLNWIVRLLLKAGDRKVTVQGVAFVLEHDVTELVRCGEHAYLPAEAVSYKDALFVPIQYAGSLNRRVLKGKGEVGQKLHVIAEVLRCDLRVDDVEAVCL